MVLVHELVHQWFGNAVTPRTWRDLWLSEGFAEFATQEVLGDPDPDTVVSAGTDVAVTSPEAVRSLGRALYTGGATALQALRAEVGVATFDEILRTWFERYRGATATTEDFVNLAEEVADTDLADWAETWLFQPQPRVG